MQPNVTKQLIAASSSQRQVLCGLAFLALVLRIGLVYYFSERPLQVVDEAEYESIAVSLATTGDFATGGQLTSIRAPGYPFFLAAIYRVAGVSNHTAVRLVQSLLGLGTGFLLYLLGRRMFAERVGVLAAACAWFYPSFLGFEQLLLTECLFTFTLTVTLLSLARALETSRARPWLAFGALLGAGALIRSVLWVFPPFLLVFLLFACRSTPHWPQRAIAVLVPLLAFAAVIAPWTVRNTRLHKTFTTIDVMGGRNLMMGNYEHTPLYRMWDAISFHDERAWYRTLQSVDPSFPKLTQGQKDKRAMKYALEYIRNHPGQTAVRCVVRFFNFWQLERSLVAGALRENWGLPKWSAAVLAPVVFGSYAVTFLAGILGYFLTPSKDLRFHAFCLLLIGVICAVHTAVFGHSRYHLSLMPMFFLYGANLFVSRKNLSRVWTRWQFWVAAGICVMMVLGWAYELFLVELPHLGAA